MGGISGLFNLSCGIAGFRGAGGSRKQLSAAVALGWVGLIAAVVSGVLVLMGDMVVSRVCTALASAIVPVLFLISAAGVKNNR